MPYDAFNNLAEFKISSNKIGKFYSLPILEQKLGISISRLPISIRIILESILRNCDGEKIKKEHVHKLINWQPNSVRTDEIPFMVSRVILQDFTGVPLLTDLAAMRHVVYKLGKDPKKIEPLIPVDLVIDHSIQVDFFGVNNALDLNMQLEFSRNKERYEFMKWGAQAFKTFNIIPPGFGIIHQINLEHLARGVHYTQDIYYPDTLIGTDSHTTMINSIGVVGWGVGGIEAEVSMLGQPIYLLMPDVIGIHLIGTLCDNITATDLVLTITEMLRKINVVGKFVEFFGSGVESLSLTDRATIANMAPEYGATISFFPVDEVTIDYLKKTGRTIDEVEACKAYFTAQNLFGIPKPGDIDYTSEIKLDLSTITPSLAGPARPQDRIEISNLKEKFTDFFIKPISKNGFNKKIEELHTEYTDVSGIKIKNGDVLIAAITSCTNTSNPNVLLAAGLLAKKAVKSGLRILSHIKTSLTPGSRVVTQYLKSTGLLTYLEILGFNVVAYGCATCIGNTGDLTPAIKNLIIKNNIIAAAVLSGNRNFEARIHPNIKSNFLASPPLVVAFAIAGTININLITQPIGKNYTQNIYLRDIWPTQSEIQKLLKSAMQAKLYISNYNRIKDKPGQLWKNIKNIITGPIYNWPTSTYIAEPPFFTDFTAHIPTTTTNNIMKARALCIFGDSMTTDHISPAGEISESSPAGTWLKEQGVCKTDFNSYGSRRGNYKVMIRGTFSNMRIKNLMLPYIEGGLTIHYPSYKKMSIYDAAMQYLKENVPTLIFSGTEYGTGSSRDWAAKGTKLLGVKAVIARSFERIHRANLIGMGVLPLQFFNNESIQTLNIIGNEMFDLQGLDKEITPQQEILLTIHTHNGIKKNIKLTLRIDTLIEVEYYKHGGILPFILRKLLQD